MAKKADVKVVKVDKKIVVKCVNPFQDLVANIHRTPGDQWEVTKERLSAIKRAEEAQNVQLIEVL